MDFDGGMTYVEIFEAIYGREYLDRKHDVEAAKRARAEVRDMSDNDWHNWVEYKTSMIAKVRRERGQE